MNTLIEEEMDDSREYLERAHFLPTIERVLMSSNMHCTDGGKSAPRITSGKFSIKTFDDICKLLFKLVPVRAQCGMKCSK